MKTVELGNDRLGQLMRELRRARYGMSVERLAKAMGINKERLRSFELGKNLPSVHELGKFCQALGPGQTDRNRLYELWSRESYELWSRTSYGYIQTEEDSALSTALSHLGQIEIEGTRKSLGIVVGREVELEPMQRWLEKALAGERQVVFVTGEAGIGKTTVVEVFLKRASSTNNDIWIVRGQCMEHYGAGEAYMPVLEALGQLCHGSGGERLIALLDRYAPMWLLQMPSLLSAAELEALQRKVLGATRERMLREMAEAVEVLTSERLLVLVLEDLQWSDLSTLELLSILARRQQRAKLLVIGTYRPVAVLPREHPLKDLKQELQMHGHCQELTLGLLSEAAVAEYLAARFAGEAQHTMLLQSLARMVHQRTDGHPLFMVSVVDHLLEQEVIVRRDGLWELQGKIEEVKLEAPADIRQLIEHQIDHASPEEQQVLEVASVAGMEFSAAAVAAGLDQEVVEVEKVCDELIRRGQFLRLSGASEWPDGTVSSRYGFIHALYQNVLYERASAARRAQLHQKIGERE